MTKSETRFLFPSHLEGKKYVEGQGSLTLDSLRGVSLPVAILELLSHLMLIKVGEKLDSRYFTLVVRL